MSFVTWLLIGVAITVLGIFGLKLAKRWRDAGHEPDIKPPYYT